MATSEVESLENCADVFDRLPEGCIAEIISRTSPVDACRLSLLATNFRSAADSDAVWVRFLPSDYENLISRADPGIHHPTLVDHSSKKQLYRYLCEHSILIDNGAKRFSLDKWSGKKIIMINARHLAITWGDNPDYWRWTPDPDSRFTTEVAELLRVCWLEIRGKISTPFLSPDTTYTAYLVFKLTRAFRGFEYHPAEVSVGISGDERISRVVSLDPEGRDRRRNFRTLITDRIRSLFPLNGNDRQYPRRRTDGWLEVELGEYFSEKGENRELEMTLMEVKGGNWKNGLIVQWIEIRPQRV